jgi:hypothetical protein
MAGCFEHGNQALDSIHNSECFHKMSDCGSSRRTLLYGVI